MKDKCLLQLIQENLNRLIKTKYFTKLNIVVVFNKTKMVENEKWKPFPVLNMGFWNF